MKVQALLAVRNQHMVLLMALFAMVAATACRKDLDRGDRGSGGLGVAKAGCATTPSSTINVQTFGAIPNDGQDDTPAFILATQAVQSACSPTVRTILYIPPGVYLVGRQLSQGQSWTIGTQTFTNPTSSGTAKLGINIISLTCCPNVTIRGATGSILRFRDGMDFGWNSSCTLNSTYGTMINLFGCDCAIIEHLDLDGRNQYCNLLTPCNDAYQLGYDGIIVQRSTDLAIRNVQTHHHGRDGIMFYTPNNAGPCPNSLEINNVTIADTRSEYNSRQGFSLVAGQNITVTNSTFSYTGNVFYNNPGAGLDLEPEYANVIVDNVKFTNCQFIGNRIFGVVSNYHTNVKNITFKTCNFAQTTGSGHALWIGAGRSFIFDACRIHGTITHVGGFAATEPLTMKSCVISDGPYGGQATYIVDGWLMNIGPGDAHNRFVGCTFDLYYNMLGFVQTATPVSNAYTRIFSDNLFRFNYAQLQCPPSNVPVVNCGGITCCSSRRCIAYLRHSHFSNNRFRDTQYQTTNPPANTEYLLQLQSYTAPQGAWGHAFGNTTTGNNTFEYIPGSQVGHILRQTDPTCCCGGNKNNF